MKKIFLIFFLTISSLFSLGQCKEFVRTIAADQIKPYNLDPNFFAPVVYEGDKVQFTRAFFKGNRYIIKLVGLDFLDKEILITDEDGFVIFANYPIKKKTDDKYFTDYEGNQIPWLGSEYFEFVPQESKNYTIKIKIERKAKRRKYRLKGCLGVVIGFMPINENQ